MKIKTFNKAIKQIEAQAAVFRDIGKTDMADGLMMASAILNASKPPVNEEMREKKRALANHARNVRLARKAEAAQA